MVAGERIEQHSGRSRRQHRRAVHRHADVGAAVLLQIDPDIAAIEQMQFDRIADQPGEAGGGGDAHAQAQHRIVPTRLGRSRHAAHVMLAAGEKQRVACQRRAIVERRGGAGQAAHGHAALDCRACRNSLGEQDRVERSARHAERRAWQGSLDDAIPRDDARPRDSRGAKRFRRNAEPRERFERAPAEESAANRIPGFAATLDQQMRRAGAREHDRGACSGRAAAHDQRGDGAHSFSTHKRNGKAR